MSPTTTRNLSRLLCVGLCCFSLSLYAEDNSYSAVSVASTSEASTEIQNASATPDLTNTTVSASASAAAPSAGVAANASAPAATPLTATPIGGGRHLASVTLALLAIIALIFLLSWFVKRFGQGGFAQNPHMKVLSALPLGTRERIVLIEAGGQQLLLGITATSINTLHVFNEPVIVDSGRERSSDFSQKLMAILQQRSTGPSSGEPDNNNDNSAAR